LGETNEENGIYFNAAKFTRRASEGAKITGINTIRQHSRKMDLMNSVALPQKLEY